MKFGQLIYLITALLVTGFAVRAQDSTKFSTYYYQRLSQFRTLPDADGEIIFLGNSITDRADWSELFNEPTIRNRGISGDNTDGILYRLHEVTRRKPSKIFLMIGINDLTEGKHRDSVVHNQMKIIRRIKMETPATRLHVQSILPVNNELKKFTDYEIKEKAILYINKLLKDSASFYGYTYIDLHSVLQDGQGKLNKHYTNDGLHLTGDAYILWKQVIYPYVFDAEQKPSLIPLPQKLSWGASSFLLYRCSAIVADNASLDKEALRLKYILLQTGWDLPVVKRAVSPKIELRLAKVEAPMHENEAYHLSVSESGVTLTANTAHGIFNGIQTLMQLMRDGMTIPSCEINDWPAFSWRGYMIDVGRNFMPVNMLKQQIEAMSRYKLNIFHFHFTEDIAWRLAIKRYPQLTDASAMIRNPGQFYSEEEFKDLINFCRERHITLVPEIDMPGHSAAFRRAMHTDMQTDSGLAIVKNILKEFFETYDLPYIHIGADEVKITMENFLPDVIKFIHSYHKTIIGWEPGGNFTNDVIRQLWMGDEAPNKAMTGVRFIDSRHLYINHMDPLEAITTIYFREIGNQPQGDSQILGATLCLWPDRRVESASDVLQMNPAYPGIIAFGERIWRGGGRKGWTASIGEPGSDKAGEFTTFENRLMDHKRQYFTNLPFPYARQSNTVWSLYGPYDNGGNLSASLVPEAKRFDTSGLVPFKRVIGGTIMLRHWWFPLVKGVLENPKENTTVYASTRIWSDVDVVRNFWIGFNNISRSPNTDSPPKDTWNERKSEVWVNGEKIAPPVWKRGGVKGDAEIPLVDEGYEYRAPTRILLKRGWNTVWIKAPVGSFKGRDWHNPVKWEFTFVEVDE